MATLTITLSGSAVVNGSKSFTVSDPDITAILNWAASQFGLQGQTNAQILIAWIQQTLVNPTLAGVQKFQTAVNVPPPIVIQ